MFYIGLAVIFICVFGGFVAFGGHIEVILEGAPKELVVIGGAAAGAFIIGNTKQIIGQTGQGFKDMLAGPKYKKEDYLELLSLIYMIFKLIKGKGMLALESHIENPHESSVFQNFPKILADHHVIEFICDYLRMMVMGSDNPHQMEDVINEELETHHEERHQVAAAFQTMADGLPALGIVAAVLGVIKTMGSIDQPPPILGKMIGGALVGTFLGVFLAYGVVGPIASNLTALYSEEGKYFQCIKSAMIAFMNGSAPVIALEFARKTLMSHVRPTFMDVELKVQELPKV